MRPVMATGTRSDFGSQDEPANGHGSVDAGPDERPIKLRRTTKACIQCRVRKQRCDGQSRDDPVAPCSRCQQLRVACSFMTTSAEEQDDAQATKIAKTAHKVERLQKRVAEQEDRIQRLERLTRHLSAAATSPPEWPGKSRGSAANGTSPHNLNAPNSAPRGYESPEIIRAADADDRRDLHSSSSVQSDAAQTCQEALEAVDLDTPLSTLRCLQPSYLVDQSDRLEDPVSAGLLTVLEAQDIFDLYFASCHKWAPVLCPRSQRSAATVRATCPTLFTSVCAIGSRFMDLSLTMSTRYPEIVRILDATLSRILLKPHPSDGRLETIQALLLYVQWMPVDVQGSPQGDRIRTRYNDVSAWSIIGLAIRYALLLGLQDSPSAFSPEREASASVEDAARLRVWINLLSCDANLMLSSGLPGSLNPEPVAHISRTFASHRNASLPDDTRAAALCELVAILKRAARSSGSPNVRALDSLSLRRANLEFEAWEAHWNQTLGPEVKHNQMPYTTLRSNRLTVNSACLSNLLARSAPESYSPPPLVSLHLVEALDVSISAACCTILALSQQAPGRASPVEFRATSIPPGPLTADRAAVESISFSVDSSWVSHSFAAMFLVLCFTRNAIDDNLNLLALTGLFSRIITLAAEIFSIICAGDPLVHPAAEYQKGLIRVFSLLLGEKDGRLQEQERPKTPRGIETDLESLFGLMMDHPASVFRSGWTPMSFLLSYSVDRDRSELYGNPSAVSAMASYELNGLTVTPILNSSFGAEVSGVDWQAPVPADTVKTLISLQDKYGVIIFRGTGLDNDRHVAFSKQLGDLEVNPAWGGSDRVGSSYLFDVSNIEADGSVVKKGSRRWAHSLGNALWHTDSSFNQHRSKYSLLLAHKVPGVGKGTTEFADTRAAWNDLDEELKADLREVVVEHELWHSRRLAAPDEYGTLTAEERGKKPPSYHQLVQKAPNGGETLFLAAHAKRLLHKDGTPLPDSQKRIWDLIAHCTQPKYTFVAEWTSAGDMMWWDNRQSMHRASPYDENMGARDVRRSTVFDDGEAAFGVTVRPADSDMLVIDATAVASTPSLVVA
ncbi:hypothetical protein GQ53DRAFT_804356 [Thozetella sp. PMI_491]|nr:hypothetical protein GQ53DRAFT_804356 [Thozetella sp. PMI_491]